MLIFFIITTSMLLTYMFVLRFLSTAKIHEKKTYSFEIKQRIHNTEYVKNNAYQKWKTKHSLFSKQELYFYKKLFNYTDNKNLFVFSKVRIADLVEPKIRLDNSEFMSVFLKLSQKHVDFVITNLE